MGTPADPSTQALRAKDEEIERLRRSLIALEERYFDLYDLAPAGILTTLEDGRILEVNLTLARMLGVEQEDLRGSALERFVHPDDRERWERHHSRVLTLPGETSEEFRFVRASGPAFCARVECRLGHDLDGRLLHRSAVVDITELVRAREELLRLRAALDQAHDGLAFADMQGAVLFTNLTWAREHGYAPEELLGRPLSLFHTPDQLEKEVTPFNRKVLELGSFAGEVGHVHRNGTVFRRWMSTVLLHDADDKVTGFLGMTVDLNERQTLFKAVPDVVYRLDARMGLMDWNSALERVSGYSAEELRGMDALAFFRSDRAVAEQGIREAVEKGWTYRDARLLTRAGEEIPFHWSAAALRAADGSLTGLVGVGRDLRTRL